MIWIILLVSAIIRLWGINFAFPLRYAHIDESVVIFYTTRFFTGDFNPNPFFDYPTLYLYLLFFCYFLFFCGGFIFGKFEVIHNFIVFCNTNAVPFVLIGRLLTVVFSVTTIYLTYLFAKKLFDKKTGLIAALFLSLSWQHILSSHYATTDIAATFFSLLSIYFIWDIYTKNDLKAYLLAGFFCGLSIAVKYYGGILFLAIILFGWKNKKYILYSFFVTIAGFFVGCPYAFIDYVSFCERFIDRFNLIVGGKKSKLFHGFLSYPNIVITGLGHFLTVTSVLGIGFLVVKKIKQNIFLLIIISILIIFFGSWKGLSRHYILVLYPLFATISAVVVLKIRSKIIFFIAVGLFIIASLPKIIKTDILLSQKDTRVTSREWVLKNIPEKAKILRGHFCPEFPKDNYSVTIDWYSKIKNGDFAKIRKDFDYVITSSLHTDSEMFTNNLENYGTKIYEISKKSFGEFQNPTIKIYKLK
ncbi:MAG: glycosyltransferase family 39 protein [Elusimicrobiota bacterium]